MPTTLIYSSRENKEQHGNISIYYSNREAYILASKLIDSIFRVASQKRMVFQTDRFVCFSNNGSKVIRLKRHK